jgi:hypothetical protein
VWLGIRVTQRFGVSRAREHLGAFRWLALPPCCHRLHRGAEGNALDLILEVFELVEIDAIDREAARWVAVPAELRDY